VQQKIVFLHLDIDVIEPKESALDLLYDQVVPIRLIVIEDYNSIYGATDAVYGFCKKIKM
jgi:hypothetical protein